MKTLTSESSTIEWVRDYYGRLLGSSSDLKTNACCAAGTPPGFIAAAARNVHDDVLARFYGCGYPIPHAVEGRRVLDLGCGTGRDVYILAQLVGAQGTVIGLDMTQSQLEVARRTEAWHAERFGYQRPNTRFVEGYLEDLSAADIAPDSIDVIVSNCVVNLSPRKDLALQEAFRVLKPGGELYLSDVVVDRRLPPDLGTDPVLYAECLGGALYRHDFETLARRSGFLDPRVMSETPITINNGEVAAKVGAARFTSVTFRLFKLADLDDQCEDYGQLATYRGGIHGAETLFWLDDHHAFEAGRPERVCGNTADMVAKTRFAEYFTVAGGKDTHYGAYPCGPTLAATQYGDEPLTAATG